MAAEFGSIASGIGGLLWGGVDAINQGMNTYMQAESAARAWNTQLTQWEREDNAVQRRVKDLRAAGLSPTLAAGGAAATTMGPQIRAPQLPEHIGAEMQNRLINAAQLTQTAAQLKLLDAQTRKENADADFAEQTVSERVAQTGLKTEQIRLANAFSKEINPMRITEQAKRIEGMTLDNINKNIDSKAKLLGIELGKLDGVAKEYKNILLKDGYTANISSVTSDAAIKMVLLDNLGQENAKRRMENQTKPFSFALDKIKDVMEILKGGKSLLSK